MSGNMWSAPNLQQVNGRRRGARPPMPRLSSWRTGGHGHSKTDQRPNQRYIPRKLVTLFAFTIPNFVSANRRRDSRTATDLLKLIWPAELVVALLGAGGVVVDGDCVWDCDCCCCCSSGCCCPSPDGISASIAPADGTAARWLIETMLARRW